MRNRWFHRPALHSTEHGAERRVGWIELFYDLVYVATIIQLGNALSYNPTPLGFVGFAGLFAAVWYAWTGFTFYSNRFLVDDFLHRVLVFTKMFGIAAMAVTAPGVFKGYTQDFSFAYVLVRLVLVAFYVRAWLQADNGNYLSRRYAIGFSVGALFWLVSAFLPTPWVFLFWTIGLLLELAVPISPAMRELARRFPPDAVHMAERYGLLTIIVLGESFVKVLTDLSGAGERPGTTTALIGGLALLVTCSVWWIYFDDIVHSRIRARPGARFVWVYTHLPLTLGITAFGVGIKKAVALTTHAGDETAARWLVTGSLALVFASIAIIDWVTERQGSNMDDEARVWVRSVSAVVLFLLGVAGAYMTGWVCLVLVAAVCVAQVLADLMMAPLEEPEMDHELLQSSFPVQRPEASQEEAIERPKRIDPLEAVRRGTPSDLRRGLYFFFMSGGWWRLLGSAVFVYGLINMVFATLYVIEPDSIANARPDSFADAFFFSVQTFSTIGFGTLTPVSAWGNTLVVIEAVLGLLFTAMVTGLVFAKAARPTASVLFSNVIVVTRFDGKPALMLRLGNARGNEVAEAHLNLTALCGEQTEEGHRIRRIYDLELMRPDTPMFILTWTAIHILDETSPLYGLDTGDLRTEPLLITATMTGFDGTYAQTIHARHIWYPEDIRLGHRFVDVISELEDGRLAVEYRRFHDVVPEV